MAAGGRYLFAVTLLMAGCAGIVGLDEDFSVGDATTTPSAHTGGTGGTGGTGANGGAAATGGSGGMISTGGGGTGGGPTGWTRRRELTLELGGNVTVDDFPVLVVLTTGNIDYGAVQGAGQDLRFTAQDGSTLLAHEIELFQTGGKSFVWVGVPQIAQTTTTKPSIWMYYGNPTAPDGQDAANVWSPGFHAVWHLGQSLGDSTGNNPAATNYGTTVATGVIAEARSFAELQQQYIDTGVNQDLATYTVEAWARGNHAPTTTSGIDGPIMRQRNFQMCWDHINSYYAGGISFRSGGTWDGAHYNNLSANQWYYLAATYDGAMLRAYQDGTPVDQQAMGTPDAETHTAKIGRHAFDNQMADHFDGLIDEVRVSSVVRTSDWIRAQHRSMTDTGFVSYGAEEVGNWTLP